MILRRQSAYGILLIGVGPRLVGAALIVAALWSLFFWVTSTPGSL